MTIDIRQVFDMTVDMKEKVLSAFKDAFDEGAEPACYFAPDDKLQKEGKIGIYGASNWTMERFREANAFAEANGMDGFCAINRNTDQEITFLEHIQ